MTNILSKRLIQMTLLGIFLVSGLSIADPESRLEPINAPVPVERSAQAEDRSGIETKITTDRDKAGFERVITEELETSFNEHEGESFPWALLIPIFFVTFVFGGPIVLIIVLAVLHYRSKARRAQIKAELTLKALEAGRELPPELSEQNSVATADNLRRGVKNVGLGIGVVAGLSFLVGFDIGALGFVLVGIGGAQLVLWKLENPKSNDPV